MTKELLIEYFKKNSPFFNEEVFIKKIDFCLKYEPRTEEALKFIYQNYALKEEVLLLPRAVTNLIMFEYFPKLGAQFIRHIQVSRYNFKKLKK